MVGVDAGCSTAINHAVVVVGYTEKVENPDPKPDPEPEPKPDPEPKTDPEPEPVPECNAYRWWYNCEDK